MYMSATRRNRRAIREGRIRLIHGRFDALPWEEGVIDKCLAVHVAYFMDLADMHEVRRVLRPGGTLSIVVTHKTVMEHWKIAHPSTHRLFVANDLADLISKGGFLPEDVSIQSVSLGSSSFRDSWQLLESRSGNAIKRKVAATEFRPSSEDFLFVRGATLRVIVIRRGAKCVVSRLRVLMNSEALWPVSRRRSAPENARRPMDEIFCEVV